MAPLIFFVGLSIPISITTSLSLQLNCSTSFFSSRPGSSSIFLYFLSLFFSAPLFHFFWIQVLFSFPLDSTCKITRLLSGGIVKREEFVYSRKDLSTIKLLICALSHRHFPFLDSAGENIPTPRTSLCF
ncbi:hypothetical protein BGX38DRAFT_365805 [Terfezia claveryi]|nr:hypothetical protein BGX38DRAFT_365805 [Terfezia claveryi]